MRRKRLKLDVVKRTVFLTVDSRERGVKNTAGTVNGEGESQKPSNMPSDLLSILWKKKAGQYGKYTNKESENKQS